MAVWAIADLHLSFGAPEKSMNIFGPNWLDHHKRIESNWLASIAPDDLILIPGDISWAMTPDQAKIDLEWIDKLPGTKLLLRGNHDYWWTSLSKVEKILPPTLHLIQNNAFSWENIVIGGARLWDTKEYNYNSYIDFQENPKSVKPLSEKSNEEESERIFQRELIRLETSLKELNGRARGDQKRIVMTHYPPIGPDFKSSQASELLEKYKIEICVFGHLHNVRANSLHFQEKNGVNYYLTSCDYLSCHPLKILD